MKGVPTGLVRFACRAGTRDFCSALAALVGLVQNIFYAPYTISIHRLPNLEKLFGVFGVYTKLR
jgi:hypothetical protein